MNAYAEPVVSLDLDLVVATGQVETVAALAESRFDVHTSPHRLNISAPRSRRRRSDGLVEVRRLSPTRASEREVLDLRLRARLF